MIASSKIGLLLLLIPTLAFSQIVSSSVNGALLDPSGARIPGASCALTKQETGAVLRTSSGVNGLFTFPSVLPGVYTLSVQAAGFRALQMKDVVVTAGELRTLGNLTLQVGEVRDSVSVTAEAAPLQLATAEKGGLVTGRQLNDISLKGRDFFAFLQMIPGVVDTTASREVSSAGSGSGISINGNRGTQKNFNIDGMTSMDTGSNGSVAFVPNMDAIGEVKVLASNYQAEYGRQSGGQVSVITKSGSREFHGSAYNYYRHESLNANNFFNNRTGTAKAPYRYRISGYSLGGPIYIPGKFNTGKDKFFFFWSQEYTGVKLDYGTNFVNMPTQAERNGNYSQSRDVNGALIPVKDPATAQPFANNIIPTSRINSLGQSILNFYPLPNYTDPDPRNLYRRNYRASYSGNTPKRDDIFRGDAYVTPSLHLYYRFGRDTEHTIQPWSGKAGNINFLLTPVLVDRYGGGQVIHATKTFSPTFVNEVTIGFSRLDRFFDYVDKQKVARSTMGNPPQWYQDPGNPDYLPIVTFGGQPSSPPVNSTGGTIPNYYHNPVQTLLYNLSKVYGSHSFKVGLYLEHSVMNESFGPNYRGTFNFSVDANNPFNSGHSFANALLGNFQSYSETTMQYLVQYRWWNTEWYVQDNWRVSKRLTLDLGMRFSHMPPSKEILHQSATFDPALYEPLKAPAIYIPAFDAAGRRVAKDPLSGNLAVAPLIGQYVPGTGNTANGTAVGGVNGYPEGLFEPPRLTFAPRIGFAYDLFGDGKTALRGGWGAFRDTQQQDRLSVTAGNPPVAYTPTLYYGSLNTYAQTGGALGPTSMGVFYGPHKDAIAMNFSLGVQRQIWESVIDASYVGTLARHLFLTRNLNAIPMYARFDPKNADPTQPTKALPDNFMRPYPGWGDLTNYENAATSNYHSLQIAVNRRFTRGIQYGIAYTYSKALGVGSSDAPAISPYFPARQRNYGPMSIDRRNILVLNYMYDLPKVSHLLGWKPAGWVLDNWHVAGITSFISGAPFTPGINTSDSQDITGSTESARITVTGNPNLDKGERTFYRNFITEVFQRTPLRGFGNAGVGILTGPGISNWDISVSKRVPLFSEGRYIQFRAELFNAWNNTQFSGLYTSAQFNTAGVQVDPNFGAYSAARAPRTIQLSLRLSF